MIRRATLEDMPELMVLAAEFYDHSPHKGLGEFQQHAAENVARFLMTHEFGILLMDNQGAVGGLLSPLYFDPQKTIAEITCIWGQVKARHLRKAFEDEAANRGADFVICSIFEDDREPAMERIMGRDGYESLERRFIKRV